MCRLVAFLGHPLRLAELITEPKHSLINQSYNSIEREEPLNGDGFGVGWYHPTLSKEPVLFREITPAWNSENLRQLARVTRSTCILGHVRAASHDSAVHYLNCHPFSHQRFCFMHNGRLGGFSRWRRRLLEGLSDEAFHSIRGSTDSEHAFALFLDLHAKTEGDHGPDRTARAVRATLKELEELRRGAGVEEDSYMNFVISEGDYLVATRYSTVAGDEDSLHYSTGKQLRCDDGTLRHQGHRVNRQDHDFAVIASEATTPGFEWKKVPGGHLVKATHGGNIELEALSETCR